MQIFYINLDTATDRRRHIENQLLEVGLTAERISATRPADLPSEFVTAHCYRPAARVTVSPVELACTMSHRRAWAEIVTRDLPLALILEDDVYLSRRLSSFLNLVEPLCAKLDVLRVETENAETRVGPARAGRGGVTLHRLHSVVWGCAGYIVTRRGAAKLIGDLARYDIPVDHVLYDYHFKPSQQLDIRVSIPAGVANGPAAEERLGRLFKSGIEEERRQRQERQQAGRGHAATPVPAPGPRPPVERRGRKWRWFVNRILRRIVTRTIPLY